MSETKALDLDRLEVLCAQAMPGPWRSEPSIELGTPYVESTDIDNELIDTAREALPQLLRIARAAAALDPKCPHCAGAGALYACGSPYWPKRPHDVLHEGEAVRDCWKCKGARVNPDLTVLRAALEGRDDSSSRGV